MMPSQKFPGRRVVSSGGERMEDRSGWYEEEAVGTVTLDVQAFDEEEEDEWEEEEWEDDDDWDDDEEDDDEDWEDDELEEEEWEEGDDDGDVSGRRKPPRPKWE
jgi:hypothetical protein